MLTTKTEGTKLTKRPNRGGAETRFIDFVYFEFFVNFVAKRANQKRRELCVVTR